MAYRAPVHVPVSTSFGTMKDRPAVFLRIEDADGYFGWGEIFANWPSSGAEHRVRLLIEDIAELVLGRDIPSPAALFEDLTCCTRIRALQCGEWGPFRQVIAGFDIAVHDLFARRAGVPVRTFLNPEARDTVGFYASGIHVSEAGQAIETARQNHAQHFKVKVGFDMANDVAGVRESFSGLKEGETLYLDANQSWNLQEAVAFLEAVEGCPIGWMEEPIPADSSDNDWAQLDACTTVPLAGGENIAGRAAFSSAIALGALQVIQPDIAKWGGFTGCLEVANKTISAGRRYCPHFLGGGIGLIASAHLLAAAGGDGLLEVDVNPNPLRDLIAPLDIDQFGNWIVSDRPGLGIEVDLATKVLISMTRLSEIRSECRVRAQATGPECLNVRGTQRTRRWHSC